MPRTVEHKLCFCLLRLGLSSASLLELFLMRLGLPPATTSIDYFKYFTTSRMIYQSTQNLKNLKLLCFFWITSKSGQPRKTYNVIHF